MPRTKTGSPHLGWLYLVLLLLVPYSAAAAGLAPDGSYRQEWRFYTTHFYTSRQCGNLGTPFLFNGQLYRDLGTLMFECAQTKYEAHVGQAEEGRYIQRYPNPILKNPYGPELVQTSLYIPFWMAPYVSVVGDAYSWNVEVWSAGHGYLGQAIAGAAVLTCPAFAPVSENGAPCACPDPGEIRLSPIRYGEWRCFPAERYRLELSTIPLGMALEIEPGETIVFEARVVDSNGRPAPVEVKFEAGVDATSGGHDHGDESRPRGRLGGPTGGAFTAPAAAGDYTITASCVDKPCNTETADIKVGIKGLVPLAGSASYELIRKPDSIHTKNHYLTVKAASRITVMAVLYHNQFPDAPVLQLNDASLERGGLFDIAGNWAPKHHGHRRGTEIDVRANDAPGAIPSTAEHHRAFEKHAAVVTDVAPLFEIPRNSQGVPQWDLRHYHVYLE